MGQEAEQTATSWGSGGLGAKLDSASAQMGIRDRTHQAELWFPQGEPRGITLASCPLCFYGDLGH